MGWGNGCECRDEVGIPEGGGMGARAGLWGGSGPPHHSLGLTVISEHLPAVGTEEVLGVPGLVQGREDFLCQETR